MIYILKSLLFLTGLYFAILMLNDLCKKFYKLKSRKYKLIIIKFKKIKRNILNSNNINEIWMIEKDIQNFCDLLNKKEYEHFVKEINGMLKSKYIEFKNNEVNDGVNNDFKK